MVNEPSWSPDKEYYPSYFAEEYKSAKTVVYDVHAIETVNFATGI